MQKNHSRFTAARSSTMVSAELDGCCLHILFLPLMAPGHMIPMLDIAKLFAGRGVRCTIATTFACAPTASSFIENTSGIDIHLIRFPPSNDAQDFENLSSLSTGDDRVAFICSLQHLQPSVEAVLSDLNPDAMIADMFFPWATALCAEHGLPRLVFYGTSAFASSAMAAFHRQEFHEEKLNGGENTGDVLVLESLPHKIKLLKTQILGSDETSPQFAALMNDVMGTEEGCYGVLINSFYDLEPDCRRHYREVIGRRAWFVGPASLISNENTVRGRAGGSLLGNCDCEEWLHSKARGSVLYICFGSLPFISVAQLREISLALESADVPFIWVVPNAATDGTSSAWLSDVIQRKEVAGECLLIHGWAPQRQILSHPSVGGFMTHCGWNSSLESISAGVPIVTWPRFADQFYNEKLLVDVLKVGVTVGSAHNTFGHDRPIITAANIEAAIKQLMVNGDDEAVGRRQRAKVLATAARRAVMEGGTSFHDVSELIKELEMKKIDKSQAK